MKGKEEEGRREGEKGSERLVDKLKERPSNR